MNTVSNAFNTRQSHETERTTLMEKILGLGRYLFAASIAAFGIENLIWAHSGQQMLPVIPWVPAYPWLAYLAGLALLPAGIFIAINFHARLTATALGGFFLLCVLSLQIARLSVNPLDAGLSTCAFETLAMCGAALMLAAILPQQAPDLGRLQPAANGLIRSGRFLFAASALVFGINHFVVLAFVASLVPHWIPGSGVFWTVFTAFVFITSAFSFATRWLSRWAGAGMGLMFLLWFVLLHAPRVLSLPKGLDPDEWSSAFIALAMCGGSWIAALSIPVRHKVDSPQRIASKDVNRTADSRVVFLPAKGHSEIHSSDRSIT